jgi:hypothetical protein
MSGTASSFPLFCTHPFILSMDSLLFENFDGGRARLERSIPMCLHGNPRIISPWHYRLMLSRRRSRGPESNWMFALCGRRPFHTVSPAQKFMTHHQPISFWSE